MASYDVTSCAAQRYGECHMAVLAEADLQKVAQRGVGCQQGCGVGSSQPSLWG